MDKTVKDRWIENLKSGEFKQTSGAVHEDGRYCCLGVLEVTIQELSNADELQVHESVLERCADDLRYGAGLPGWSVTNAVGLEPCLCGELADLNDEGQEFPDIAEVIERTL